MSNLDYYRKEVWKTYTRLINKHKGQNVEIAVWIDWDTYVNSPHNPVKYKIVLDNSI